MAADRQGSRQTATNVGLDDDRVAGWARRDGLATQPRCLGMRDRQGGYSAL